MRNYILFVVTCLLLGAPRGWAGDLRGLEEGTCDWHQYVKRMWDTNRVDFTKTAICRYEKQAAAAVANIAEEKAMARASGGGVVDKKYIYEQQEKFRAAKVRISELKERIQRAKPMKCTDQRVKNLLACIRDSDDDSVPGYCTEEPMLSLATTMSLFIAAYEGDGVSMSNRCKEPPATLFEY